VVTQRRTSCHLYGSPCIVRILKSRKLRWLRIWIGGGRQERNAEFLWANLFGNAHLEGREEEVNITMDLRREGCMKSESSDSAIIMSFE